MGDEGREFVLVLLTSLPHLVFLCQVPVALRLPLSNFIVKRNIEIGLVIFYSLTNVSVLLIIVFN